jgi:hypothetical protein
MAKPPPVQDLGPDTYLKATALYKELADSLFHLWMHPQYRSMYKVPGIRPLDPILGDLTGIIASLPPGTPLTPSHPLFVPLSRTVFLLSSLTLPRCVLPVYGLMESSPAPPELAPLRTLPLSE